MHTDRPSPHGTLFSSCLRKLPCMSAGSSKLLQEIKAFEEALAHQLEALKPEEGSGKKILCLPWLASALALALEKHKEAVSLIPPLEFPLLLCDEKWMNDYMDQTARILDVCNALTSAFCNIEQGHLLIRHACHTLLDVKKLPLHEEACSTDANCIVLHQERLSSAHRSLREWLDLQVVSEPSAIKFSNILRDMIKGLVPPREKVLAKGKGFLYALYGANATAVFVFYVFSLAISQENELLSFILPIPSTSLWLASISQLAELAKDEAKQHSGSISCLRILETRVKDLFSLVERLLDAKAWPLPEEEMTNLAGAVESLSLLLDDIAQGLDLLGTNLNEMFKAIVLNRSALLDKLGDFGTDDL
eukprot:c15341_g1_i1 orf=306-1391(+)